MPWERLNTRNGLSLQIEMIIWYRSPRKIDSKLLGIPQDVAHKLKLQTTVTTIQSDLGLCHELGIIAPNFAKILLTLSAVLGKQMQKTWEILKKTSFSLSICWM